MPCVGIFVKHSFAFSIETKINFVNQNKGSLYKGQSKFSYKLTFWLISIENRGKEKSKITLRVEIN